MYISALKILLKNIIKPITYIIQRREGQDGSSSPPPKHIKAKYSLKEEINESASPKSNDSTYLYQSHPIKQMEMVHDILETPKAKLDENKAQ